MNPIRTTRLLRATLFAALFATAAFADTGTLTFAPTKDASAKAKFPDTNYGPDTIIQVSNQTGYAKHIFMQFTVAGIPPGATGIVAKVHLNSQTTGTGRSITVHKVTSTSWGETTITWNNQPALGTAMTTVSSYTAGQDAIWDISTHVTGNGTYAIGFDGTYSGDTTFGSRESTTPPSLVVTYTVTYTAYHGNTHAHSIYSHDSAPTNTTPDGLYSIAQTSNYNYFTVTDHSQSDVFVPTDQNNAAWVASKNDGYAATTDGTFVGIAGYEHSENNQGCANTNPGTGHYTVLNTKAYTNAEDCGIDIPGFYNFLKTAQSDDSNPIVVGFNHPGTTQYNNWAYRDAQLTGIITLCELVNSNDNVHEAGWRASLDAGWKTSPTSGGDTHASCCGIANDTSRAYVWATGLNRAAIIDAMHNRRTYAALHDESVVLSMYCNNVIMGQTLSSPSTFTFAITLNSATTYDSIQIMGSQSSTTPVASVTVNGTTKTWNPVVNNTTDKYFYVRGIRGGSPFAWSAPIWTGR